MDPLRSSGKDSPINYPIQTPFRTNNHFDTYSRVLQGELQFPDDPVMDQDTKSLIHDVSVMRWFATAYRPPIPGQQLLHRDPALRIKEPEVKCHPYFSMM